MGLLDWLGINGGGAPGLAPNELEYVQSQGFSPTPNPLTGNRQAALQGLWSGLSQLGAGLAAAGARRPVNAPGVTVGQAFSGVGPAVQQGTAIARQQSQMERQQQEEEQWRRLAAQDPILAQLPMSIGQHVLSARLSREPRDPPDPRRNFITTRNGIFDISSGTPVPVGGTGGGGGGSGGPGAAPFGASESSRAWGVIMDPRADPTSQIYHAAYGIVSAPRLQQVPDPNNPNGTILAEIRPDMSRFRPPGIPGAQAPQPATDNPLNSVAGAASAPIDAASSLAPPVQTAQTAPQVPGVVPPVPAVPQAPGGAGQAPSRTITTLPGTARTPEPSDGQRTAAGYAARMQAAEEILSRVQGGGYDPTNLRDAAAARTGIIGNFAMSDQGQQYQQAQMDWVRAKLRRESGAVIGEQEMASEIRTYFPQPGDSPAVIAQKARARQVAQQAMQQGAGNAYRPPSAPPTPTPTPTPAPQLPAGPRTSQAQSANRPRAIPLPPRAPGETDDQYAMRFTDGQIYQGQNGMLGRYNAQRRTFTPIDQNAR